MSDSNFRNVLSILSLQQRRGAGWQVVLATIGMVLETLGVGIVIPAVTLMSQDELPTSSFFLRVMEIMGQPSRHELVIYTVATLVGIYFVKLVFLGFMTYSQAKYVAFLSADLSQKLFRKYLTRPYTFHLQHNSALLMNNVTGEVGVFTGSIIAPAIMLLSEFLVIAGLFIMMVFAEPVGAVVSGAVLGLAAWSFNRVTKKKIRCWSDKRYFHEGLRIQHLQQGLNGVKDVLLLGREQEFLDQFQYHNEEGAKITYSRQALQQLPRLWIEFLAVFGLGVVIFLMLTQGKQPGAMVPVLALFAAAAFRLMPSVNRLLGAVQSIRFGLPAIALLKQELAEQGSQDGHDLSSLNRPLAAQMRVDNVHFSYPLASRPALNGVTVEVRKGECVGFIGQSGSGKSTLVDVILGLLAPDRGHVVMDGDDIRLGIRNWQNQIGYVPQAIYLTDDSLRRNVAFGVADEKIDDARVKTAIRQAQLEEFVNSLPEGLATPVGERGVRLSGGQRQRIGIARALYHNPTVLVLDEATSALDTATETEVMKAVNELRGEKTIIIVAHRLSTVARCDRIYRMADGKVLGEGTPLEMIPLESGAEIRN